MSVIRNEAEENYNNGVRGDYLFYISGTKAYKGKGSRTLVGMQIIAQTKEEAVNNARKKGMCKIDNISVIAQFKLQ